MSEHRYFSWRGVKHSGIASTGPATLLPSTMAAMVERFWRAGWSSLTGIADCYQEVGGIRRLDGKRVWWAQSDTPCAHCGRYRAPHLARYDRWFCDETCVSGFERNRK